MLEVLISLLMISALIQLIWLYLQLKSFKNKTQKKNLKGVSVIIASNNEVKNLKKLIPELANQKYEADWEIIVTLDRSTDSSLEYLRELQIQFPRLSVLEQKQEDIKKGESAKKSALLKAINQSNYPLILQTDADCYPRSKQWIEEMVASLGKDGEFVIGLSPYEQRPGLLNQFIQFDTSWTAGSMIYFANQGKAYMSLGRNQLVDKDYFFSKGGYGKSINISFGDDDLLIQNLDIQKKCKICVTNDGQTVSIPESNWNDWLNQKRRHLMAGNYYPNSIIKELILNYLTIPFYLLLISLLIINPGFWKLYLGIFFIRTVMFSYLFHQIARKVGSEINIVLLPLLDLLHICINLGLGIGTRLRKNIEWR